MTPIGNPQIGMVWTCMRNVKSPIKGILSPVDGRNIWELGNATTPKENRAQDGSFWRLVPSFRKPDQNHIKEAFASDLALGYCKLIDEALPPATPTQQYGVRYVTVTSTITSAATAAMGGLAAFRTSKAAPLPLQTKAASMSRRISADSAAIPVQRSTTTVTKTSTIINPHRTTNKPYQGKPPNAGTVDGARSSKTWENNLDGFKGTYEPKIRTEITATVTELVVQLSDDYAAPPGAFTVHTEHTERSLMVPTAISMISLETNDASMSAVPISPASAPAISNHGGMPGHSDSPTGSPSPAVLNSGNPMGGSSALGTMHGSHGSPSSPESDSVLAVEKPAPLFINNHVLTPQSGHNYVTDDGQVLIRDGPLISLSSGEQGSDHKMQVGLVSGPNGRDVLVVDGSSQTLGLSAATGRPNSGRSGSVGSGHEGMNMSGGAYSSNSASAAAISTNSPTSSGKARPAKYDGPGHKVALNWSILISTIFVVLMSTF
jgi:hypothetical protein